MVVCSYCNAAIGEGEAARDCPDCGAQHHIECWAENHGCTVYGCASAPPDEPKVTVQAADFAEAAAAPPPPPPVWNGSAAPPPPRPAPPRRPPEPMLTFAGYAAPVVAAAYAPPVGVQAKSRVAYILLGVFLGAFGAHNFYAGYKYRGIAQLAITICTLFIGAVVSWFWAVVEVCAVDRDARNVPMI
jgi:TM2 domain-containing membrane protein YozV